MYKIKDGESEGKVLARYRNQKQLLAYSSDAILYKCIDHHKNVIALDDLSEYYEECSMLKKNNCLVYSSEKGKLDGAGSKNFF